MEEIYAADFNFPAWVNKELTGVQQPEQHVSSLLIKLTLLEQDLESSLEYKASQLISSSATTLEDLSQLTSDLLGLSSFLTTLESELEFFHSPELAQLGGDHVLAQRASECKAALQEVDFYEKHTKEVREMLAREVVDLEAVGKLLGSMSKSLRFLEGTGSYEALAGTYADLEASYLTLLSERSAQAITHDSPDPLPSLHRLYQLVNRSSALLDSFLAHYKTSAEHEPGFHMELGLHDSLLRITAFIEKTLTRAKGVFEPAAQLRIVRVLLPDKLLSRCFLELPISDQLAAYQASLVPLYRFVKENTTDLTPLHSTAVNIASHLPEREALYLRAAFKGLFTSSIKPAVTAKIPSETWCLQLVEEVRKSWQRCLSMSYGVVASAWAEQVSTALEDLIGTISAEMTKFGKSALNGDLDLTFCQAGVKFDFEWSVVQRAIQQFEGILTLYGGFLSADSAFRHEFLQSISTSYFSPQHELDQELQSALTQGLPDLYRSVQAKARALREGAHFLASALRKLETVVAEAKSAVLKAFYAPIYHLIAGYSTKSCWAAEPFVDPDLPQFSRSQSEEILQIGEHFLMMPQGKAAASDKAQYREAFAMEYALVPERREPFTSLGQQFWVVVLGNSLLSLMVQKILSIRELSKAGSEQLAVDVEYLLKVTRSFAIEDGTGVHTDTLATIQQHLRGDSDSHSPVSQALAAKIARKQTS